MRITIDGVLQCLVGLLAVQGGAAGNLNQTTDGDAKATSIFDQFARSINDFAKESYKIEGTVCFLDEPFKDGDYLWLPSCITKQTTQTNTTLKTGTIIRTREVFELSPGYVPINLLCDDVFQEATSGQERGVLLLTDKDSTHISNEEKCSALKGAILDAHINTALLGEMDPKSAYGPHKALYCIEEKCSFIGDLLTVNTFSIGDRETLMRSEATICPYVTSKETPISHGLKQKLSAIIFGAIPQKITNICRSIFNHLLFRNSSHT